MPRVSEVIVIDPVALLSLLAVAAGCAEDVKREAPRKHYGMQNNITAVKSETNYSGGVTIFDLPDKGICDYYIILGSDQTEKANVVGLEEALDAMKEQEVISEENPTGKVRIGPDQALYLACSYVSPRLLEQLDADDLYGLMLYLNPVPLGTMHELKRFQTLRLLGLGYMTIDEDTQEISEETLEALSELPAMREFSLLECDDIPACWLRNIGELTELTALTLSAVGVTDEGLRHLTRLTKLRKLDLRMSKVTDRGLSVITEMPYLEELNLGFSEISDAGLKYVAGLEHLQALTLWETNVTNAGLRQLAELKDLQHLDLRETFVTPEGIAWLKKRLPEVEIRYDGTRRVPLSKDRRSSGWHPTPGATGVPPVRAALHLPIGAGHNCFGNNR